MVKKRRSLLSIMLRLTGRQHQKGWAASLAVISIGAIAMTLFCGFLANAASIDQRIETMIAESNAPDIYLTTDPRDGYDLREVDELTSHVHNILAVEERFYTYCSLSSRNAIAAIEPEMPVYSKPYKIVETTSENTATHYFIVDKSLIGSKASDSDSLHLGQEAVITIPLSSFSLDQNMVSLLDLFLQKGQTNPLKKDNLELKFKVTGSMKHIECSTHGDFNPTLFLLSSSYFRDVLRDTLAASFTPLGLEAIWKLGFQEKLGWGDGDPYGSTASFPLANQYLLRLNDPSKAKLTQSEIENYYKTKEVNNLFLVQTLPEITSVKTLQTEKTQAWQLTFVFPVVFFTVALLVSLISVRQMILKERTDIGTFKALGLSKRELHRHYAFKSMILSAIGTLAGLIIGPLLVPQILSNKYDLLYSLPPRSYVFPYGWCLLAAGVYLGATALVTFLVARKEIKRNPVESMRPEPPSQHSKKILRSKDSSWFQLSLKMAGRGIRSDKVKAGMVIIGVLGCTALLCCGYGIEDTIRYGVDTDPLIVSRADVTLFMTERIQADALAKELSFKDDQGRTIVSGYQPFHRENLNVVSGNSTYYTTVHFLGDYVSYDGASEKNHFHYSMPIDQVIISEKSARALNVRQGDVVTFSFNDIDIKATIYQTIPVFYENGIYINASSPLLSGSMDSFNAVWVDKAIPEAEIVEAKLRELPGVAICNSEASWRKVIEDAMSSILVMTNAIKVFAFLLAAVVLYDLGMLNFNEKQREIATMKVLGFRQKEIMVSIIIEVLFLSTIGILGGLALGFPFTKLVLYINQVEIVDFLYTVQPSSYVIAFSFTFFLSLLINMLLGLRIRKIMAVESLKSVE